MKLSLFEISLLAKKNKKEAEKAILSFVKDKFKKLNIKEVKINSSAVSLNSVNGFLIDQNQARYFFKFHTEENEQDTIGEYYQANILKDAGYPIITPIESLKNPGEQFLVYEEITSPTFFDICEKCDKDFIETTLRFNRIGWTTSSNLSISNLTYTENLEKILEAEKKLDKKILKIFLKTLHVARQADIEKEPINQLFYHRLVNKKSLPRVGLFYKNAEIQISNKQYSFDEIQNYQWEINGILYRETIKDLIDSAKKLLNPKNPDLKTAVTAHGDDHNGNKFLINDELRFFDPAFAGENIPSLLVFIKSTFHDCFAHPFWLYSPENIEPFIKIEAKISGNKIIITHNIKMTPLREKLLEIKINQVWKPLIKTMKEKNLLPENYQEIIKKALFCCPFLVSNLTDQNKFSPNISLIALSKAVEMGNSDLINEK